MGRRRSFIAQESALETQNRGVRSTAGMPSNKKHRQSVYGYRATSAPRLCLETVLISGQKGKRCLGGPWNLLSGVPPTHIAVGLHRPDSDVLGRCHRGRERHVRHTRRVARCDYMRRTSRMGAAHMLGTRPARIAVPTTLLASRLRKFRPRPGGRGSSHCERVWHQ